MSNLLKYPAINAKLKGMHSKILGKEELDELIRQANLKDAIYFLKNKFNILERINESMHREQIEQELNNLFISDIIKLRKYLNKNEIEIFMKFILKYKMNCVKNVFRNVTTNKDVINNLKNIDNWTHNVFRKIDGINNISEEKEFLKIIENEEYYNIFKEYENVIENAPLEEIEVKLDKYYFEEVFKLSKKVNNQLEEIIGKEIDLLNIIWIYRSKKYFEYTPEQIKEILISVNYKISKDKMKKLLSASDFDEMKKILENTIYKNIFDDENNIEYNKSRYLYYIYMRVFQTKLFNICTIFCYMNLVDIEIKNIINIIEGIRYGIDRKEIQKRIIV